MRKMGSFLIFLGFVGFASLSYGDVDSKSLAAECKKQYGSDWHSKTIDGTLSNDLFQASCCGGQGFQAFQSKVSQAKKDFIEGYHDCQAKAAEIDRACIQLNTDLQSAYTAKLDSKNKSRKKADELDFEIGKAQQKWVTLGCAKYFSDKKMTSKDRQELMVSGLSECKRSFFGVNQYCNLMQTSRSLSSNSQFAVCFTEQGDLNGSCANRNSADKLTKDVENDRPASHERPKETGAGQISH